MLFTGFPISANEAYISGLVSAVVPSEELDAETEKVPLRLQYVVYIRQNCIHFSIDM